MNIPLKAYKDEKTSRLVFGMLDILETLGCTAGLTNRRLEKMAKACLAVGGITDTLADAKSANDGFFLGTREIIAFENDHYGERISFGSYDDIRRQDLSLVVDLVLVINSASLEKQATNNPKRGYALSPLFASLVKQFEKPGWEGALQMFRENSKFQNKIIETKNKLEEIRVMLPSGEVLPLTPGGHNELQKAVVEVFLRKFGMGAQVLYIGDTKSRFLYKKDDVLNDIHFFDLRHDLLPDIVAYSKEKNVVFLIEAVYSSGPMSEARVARLKEMLWQCTCEKIFVTAFLDKKKFQSMASDIAWESEVWIAEAPDHMIHFNGSQFLRVHLWKPCCPDGLFAPLPRRCAVVRPVEAADSQPRKAAGFGSLVGQGGDLARVETVEIIVVGGRAFHQRHRAPAPAHLHGGCKAELLVA